MWIIQRGLGRKEVFEPQTKAFVPVMWERWQAPPEPPPPAGMQAYLQEVCAKQEERGTDKKNDDGSDDMPELVDPETWCLV